MGLNPCDPYVPAPIAATPAHNHQCTLNPHSRLELLQTRIPSTSIHKSNQQLISSQLLRFYLHESHNSSSNKQTISPQRIRGLENTHSDTPFLNPHALSKQKRALNLTLNFRNTPTTRQLTKIPQHHHNPHHRCTKLNIPTVNPPYTTCTRHTRESSNLVPNTSRHRSLSQITTTLKRSTKLQQQHHKGSTLNNQTLEISSQSSVEPQTPVLESTTQSVNFKVADLIPILRDVPTWHGNAAAWCDRILVIWCMSWLVDYLDVHIQLVMVYPVASSSWLCSESLSKYNDGHLIGFHGVRGFQW